MIPEQVTYEIAQLILNGLKHGKRLKPDQLQFAEAPDGVFDEWGWLRVHCRWLPMRLEQALRADHRPVQLLSETELPWVEAARVLATKEEKQVFAPLRDPLWENESAASDEKTRSMYERLVRDEGLVDNHRFPERTFELAERVLKNMEPYAEAAQEVLEATGQEPLNQTLAWERALDGNGDFGLPHEAALGAFIRPTLQALGHLTFDLKQVRVPRSLSGELFRPDQKVYRVGVCPTFRYRQFLQGLKGCYGGLAHVICENEEMELGSPWSSSMLEEAFFLWALSPDILKSTTPLRHVEPVMRILKSIILLQTRSVANLCLHWEAHRGSFSAIGEIVSELFGCALPSHHWAYGLPGWCGNGIVEGPSRAHERELWSRLIGAQWGESIRDQSDSSWFWNTEALRAPSLLSHFNESRTIPKMAQGSVQETTQDASDRTTFDQGVIDSFFGWFSESF